MAIFVVVWLSQYLLWKRKIRKMNALVGKEEEQKRNGFEKKNSYNKFIAVSRDEYANFVEDTIQLVTDRFAEKNLV